ncbi:MAG: hypothetical protein H6739_11205 [Alphaproteobacteria bacterium]|nr:hypothetical protein [Alphaproteobacteria bacterium]
MKRRIEAFLHDGGDLRATALDLYAWQRENVPAYGRFAAGAQPAALHEIPSVPVSLFKDIVFRTAAEPTAVFRTSGTTSGRRGVHAMPDPEVYELSAELWFRTLLPDCPTDNTLSLVTDPQAHPDSSLGHMVALFAPLARWCFFAGQGVDTEAAWAILAENDAPLFLPTTAFALAELLEAPGTARLPTGSVLMITGGFKGRSHTLDHEQLIREALRRLGGRVRVVGEYGMTELSSQLWDLGDGFLPPPWLHVYTVDPLTGAPVRGPGLLRFVDLANWGSCLAIETEDIGVVREGRVHLHGRLEGAGARGCSLTVEESWGRS